MTRSTLETRQSRSSGEAAPTIHVRVGKSDCPSPHSLANKVARVAWATTWLLLFRPTPRLMYGWRRLLLRLFGARIGRNARIAASVHVWAPWNLEVGDESAISHNVDLYSIDRIRIGDHATVSQYAFLCTGSHDITDPRMGLTHAPIEVGDQAWVCARAFIGPGVTVGEGGVAAAAAVVTKDIALWTVVAGNPARLLKERILRTGD
ncbi:MAG: hypothetical protein KF774_04595 [Planctomyces sp.]|nr:hypothetical protein [Planctomyces sp.]